MSKIYNWLRVAWNFFVERYDDVIDWMGHHPQIVFWLVLSYLVVRR